MSDHHTPNVRVDKSEPRCGCRHCRSEDIEEAPVMPLMYEITVWEQDGCPAAYGIIRQMDAVEREEPPYWCRECFRVFAEPRRADRP